MKVPNFQEAELAAAAGVDQGQPILPITSAALGLRFWWGMPRCLRATAAGAQRPAAIRRWVAECRAARQAEGGR